MTILKIAFVSNSEVETKIQRGKNYSISFFTLFYFIIILISSTYVLKLQRSSNHPKRFLKCGLLDFTPRVSNFPGGSDDKESAHNAGDPSSIPGLGRSPEEGNGNLLQYSCLENPMDRGAWWAI